MNTTHLSISTPTSTDASLLKVVGVNLLIWLGISTLGSAGRYHDILRHDSSFEYSGLWFTGVNALTMLFFISTGLYIFLQKNPEKIATTGHVIRLYVILVLTFFPLHVLYSTIVPTWLNTTGPHTLDSLWWEFIHNKSFTWFIEFCWFTGTFTAVIAIRIWYIGQARNATLQQTQTAYLQLELALEQQRLQSLKQQLEPHFIFNALNAISALVRTNEKSIALVGIQKLSDLLSYALRASNRDWGSVKDELDFIRDYLALQQLRYGGRLEVSINGDVPAILHGDCLPLLLQPLIENALRHDLDCHKGKSKIDVLLSLNQDQSQITIQINNQIHSNAKENPGLGLGLSQTRLRLELMYEGKASMHIKESAQDFSVVITIPSYRPDQADDML